MAVQGLLEQGNIDLARRPIVRNADGSISTVRSASFGLDGREVLLPTVSDDGKILTDDQTVEQYRRTGKHLGVFDSPDNATAYAQDLHKQQEKMYVPQSQGLSPSATLPVVYPPSAGRAQQGGNMAVMDENKRYPKFVDFGVDQSLPAPLAAQIASQQAGGGALGRGVGARKFLEQTILGPAENTINAGAGLVGAVVQPVGSFAEGFLYGGPRPSAPAADAPQTSAQAPNYPTLRSVVSPEQTAPAPALTRTPSRGQPAPAVPAPSVTTPRQAAPVYSMDSVPAGGGYMEWGDRGARGGAGSLSVTPQRARELSGQSNIVPAGTIPQLGVGSQPAYTDPQGLGRPDAPRRSTLIGDRSQGFDSVLKNLVAQATREPDSYGELFRRKGVLNALNAIAGVATSAGTNAAQDISNTRTNTEQRYNTDLTDQARAAERGVTTRGQDRLFQSGLLQNTIAARNADLQATTTREVAADRNAVLREGQKSRSADSAAQRASQERIYAGAAERELGSNPLRQLEAQIIKRVNADGTPMTEEGLANALALRDRLQAQANPYQFLLPQAQ